MGKKPEEVIKSEATKYILKLQNKKGKKIVANFGCRKIPEGTTSKRFYPVFNLGSPPFSSPFVCQNMKLKKKNKDEAFYQKELLERIKKYELKPVDLREAKPRARPGGNYCAVCKIHYKDEYFKHIKSKSHKDIIQKDPFQSYLNRLQKYYARKMEMKEQSNTLATKKTE